MPVCQTRHPLARTNFSPASDAANEKTEKHPAWCGHFFIPVPASKLGNLQTNCIAKIFFQRKLKISDLGLIPKVVALRQNEFGFGLAFLPIFTLPTATDGANAGEPFLSFEPRLVADRRFASGLYLAGGIGYRMRERTQVGNLAVDDEILFSVGAEYPLLPKISLMAEIFGGVGLSDVNGDPDGGIDQEEIPVEALVAARWRHASGLVLTGGLGRGITSGYGAPAFRMFVGAGWMTPPKAVFAVSDADGDGIFDAVDKCINEPEDKNGFGGSRRMPRCREGFRWRRHPRRRGQVHP